MTPLLDDLRHRLDSTLRTAVAAAVVAAAAVALFVCVAVMLFLWTQQNFGVIEAWAALSALFAITALAGVAYLMARPRKPRPVRRPAPTAQRWLQDPVVVLGALRLVSQVGLARMVPLLFLGGIAAGFLLGGRDTEGEAERPQPEPRVH